MQTLGASNPHNNNKEKHRGGTRITGETVDRVFTPNGGLDNGVSLPHTQKFQMSSSMLNFLNVVFEKEI